MDEVNGLTSVSAQEVNAPLSLSETNTNQSADVAATTNSGGVAQEANPVQETAPERRERMFSRDELAKIANAEANRAYEKAKKEFQVQQQNQPQNDNQFSEDKIRDLINQEANKRAAEFEAQRIAEDFKGKLVAAKDRYPDFVETVGPLDIARNPDLVMLVNGLENTADILYDLGKNPSKYGVVSALMDRNKTLAASELKRLSDSIKINQQASQAPKPNQPLSQLSPSNVNSDMGSMTLSDFKKANWLRG